MDFVAWLTEHLALVSAVLAAFGTGGGLALAGYKLLLVERPTAQREANAALSEAETAQRVQELQERSQVLNVAKFWQDQVPQLQADNTSLRQRLADAETLLRTIQDQMNHIQKEALEERLKIADQYRTELSLRDAIIARQTVRLTRYENEDGTPKVAAGDP